MTLSACYHRQISMNVRVMLLVASTTVKILLVTTIAHVIVDIHLQLIFTTV